MMKADQPNKIQFLAFIVFSALMLGWFVYAGTTGWQLFNNDGNQQKWNSSGPGYHK